MKKQFLLLAFFTLAILAGTNTAWGQLGPATNPIDPLSCIANSYPLHPFPGVPYTYKMDGTTGEEDVLTWTWWATKDNEFITGQSLNLADSLTTTSNDLVAVGPTYGVVNQAGDSVTITWSAELLTNTVYQGVAGEPTFVVGYGKGINCADNIQVYEIDPKPNFTIDIANLDPITYNTLGWGIDTSQCVDEVQSAVYNNGSHQIDINYGWDTLYFEVSAANFVDDWTPTFTVISGLATAQSAVIDIYSTRAAATTGGAALNATQGALAANGATWTGPALTATTPTEIATGVSVFVRVIITNDTEESLTTSPFELAVDAIDDGGAGIWDMEDDDCITLNDAADEYDTAIHDILPRPTITDDTLDDEVNDPNTVIIKTP